MGDLTELRQAAAKLSVDEFAKTYEHPFLAVRMTLEDEEAMYRTVVAGSHEQLSVKTDLVPVHKRPGANTFSFITIGRTQNNDIVIAINSVSKFHAMIQANGDKYTISDAGSKNGTTLNGKRIGRNENAPLSPGDELMLSPQVSTTFLDAREAHAWLKRGR